MDFKKGISFAKRQLRYVFHLGKDFQPIFVCGIAGSGNSLVAKSLFQKFEAELCDESALGMPHGSPLKIYRSSGYQNIDHYYYNMIFSSWLPDKVLHKHYSRFYRERCPLFSSSTKIIDKAPNPHMLRASRLKAIFPKSKFILVFRDPKANIEGLLRKWPLFRNSDLMDIIQFWKKMHLVFIESHSEFNKDVMGISYERFVTDYDNLLYQMASKSELTPRKGIKKFQDIKNDPHTNIRNIKDGKILLVTNANEEALKRLDEQTIKIIDRELMDFYKRLIDHYEKDFN